VDILGISSQCIEGVGFGYAAGGDQGTGHAQDPDADRGNNDGAHGYVEGNGAGGQQAKQPAAERAAEGAEAEDEQILSGGRVKMDVERHIVTVADEPVAMPLKEFDLLEYLLRNAGRVLTRGQLIDRIWGADYVGDTKTLDVHIKRLRTKIEEHPSRPKHLVTVRGLGYKFEL